MKYHYNRVTVKASADSFKTREAKSSMSAWTRLVGFVAQDGQIRLGQPVDASLDVGLAVAAGKTVAVSLAHGDIFTGTVSGEKATIYSVGHPFAVIHLRTPDVFEVDGSITAVGFSLL